MTPHSKTISYAVAGLLMASMFALFGAFVTSKNITSCIWLDAKSGAKFKVLSVNEQQYAQQLLKQYGTIWSDRPKADDTGKRINFHYLFVKNSNYKKAMAAWKLASQQKAEAVCQNTSPKTKLAGLKSEVAHWNIEAITQITNLTEEQKKDPIGFHWNYHIHGTAEYQCQ